MALPTKLAGKLKGRASVAKRLDPALAAAARRRITSGQAAGKMSDGTAGIKNGPAASYLAGELK